MLPANSHESHDIACAVDRCGVLYQRRVGALDPMLHQGHLPVTFVDPRFRKLQSPSCQNVKDMKKRHEISCQTGADPK